MSGAVLSAAGVAGRRELVRAGFLCVAGSWVFFKLNKSRCLPCSGLLCVSWRWREVQGHLSVARNAVEGLPWGTCSAGCLADPWACAAVGACVEMVVVINFVGYSVWKCRSA